MSETNNFISVHSIDKAISPVTIAPTDNKHDAVSKESDVINNSHQSQNVCKDNVLINVLFR